ncbi:MAG: hypothetical protein ACR2NR_19935 [Solirubrobacteraceae bacterium]
MTLRELLVGVEGLALLRHLYDGSSADADRRLAEVERVLADDAFAEGEWMGEANSRSGYRVWSQRYDEPGNPIIELGSRPCGRCCNRSLRGTRSTPRAEPVAMRGGSLTSATPSSAST